MDYGFKSTSGTMVHTKALDFVGAVSSDKHAVTFTNSEFDPGALFVELPETSLEPRSYSRLLRALGC